MHLHHKLITSGIILLTIGLFMGIGWYFAHTRVITTISDEEMKKTLVVDSADRYNERNERNERNETCNLFILQFGMFVFCALFSQFFTIFYLCVYIATV